MQNGLGTFLRRLCKLKMKPHFASPQDQHMARIHKNEAELSKCTLLLHFYEGLRTRGMV